jgi:integrase
MSSHALIPAPTSDFQKIQDIVVNAVRSPESKRAYRRAVADFLRWYQARGSDGFTKATVQQYRSELEKSGLAPSTINLKLTAVRRLAAEAADNGLLAPEFASGIARVKGVRSAGVRTGSWLTRGQAEDLVQLPDANSNKGKRDRVILAFLVGCGLRRNELARLQIEQVQQRDGRWVIADLRGKGNRLRTVPMPSWTKVLLDAWAAAAGLTSGPVLRSVNKSDRVMSGGISPQAIFNLVTGYGIDLHVNHLAPHDLRRTFANLAHRGHAPLEQIQFALGHASIVTTERYLGIRQDLADAPCDHLGLRIGKP